MKSVLAVLSVFATLCLVGCSGDDADPSTEASPTTGADDGGEPAATDGVITPADVPDIPRFAEEPKGVIGDVSVESCDTEPGEVTAAGTATNSGESARDVVVVISWTVGETGDVVARGIAKLEDLGPGESADWELDATVPGADTATCVTTALAGQLRSRDGGA